MLHLYFWSNYCPIKYIDNRTLKICTRYTFLIFLILFFATYIKYLCFTNLLLLGNIEINLAPFNWCKSISFYHWNINAIGIAIGNIYDGLNINGYILVRNDHLSNSKCGGVAIYYKDHLPVI